MNTQDSQGNGWVGGSIGTGLGVVGAGATVFPAGQVLLDKLSNSKELRQKAHDYYQKGVKSEYQEDYDLYRKASRNINKIADKSIERTKPYVNAAMLLYALGIPITAGLLGASLTD